MMKKKKSNYNRRKVDKDKVAEYDYHLPVLLNECIENLINNRSGIYIDGTLGGGGHAARILESLTEGGILLAFDKDPFAIEHCERKYHSYLNDSASVRLRLYNDCYSKAPENALEYGNINGLLLDLGVSSRQLDSESRGLSYRVESPLDMRFGTKGMSAEDLLNNANSDELEMILRTYGEEPRAKLIVRRLIERRRLSPLKTTFDLKEIIENCVPFNLQFKTLSRVFQAIRIYINDELNVLERTIKNIIPILATDATIVIMSYHSLEDRIVKTLFREFSSKADEKIPQLKLITKKPIYPSEQEIEANPRARSAKLRIAQKI